MIEKDIRKLQIIKNPEEYLNIIKNYSTVIKLGIDFKVYDWKHCRGQTAGVGLLSTEERDVFHFILQAFYF